MLMPLPTDPADLRRLAVATEAVAEKTASAADEETTRRHALALLDLGRIRHRLGEAAEGERLFRESADLFWGLHTPFDADIAAVASLGQAALVMDDGRDRDALAIIERMITRLGGFPAMQMSPRGPASGLGIWMLLLDRAKKNARLYEASGIAMAMLEPPASAEARVVLGKAFAWRARSADTLGHTDEAVDMYQHAIARLEMEEPDESVTALLDHAVGRVAPLLAELGRADEAAAAFSRLIERLQTNKQAWARTAVIAARAWLRLQRR